MQAMTHDEISRLSPEERLALIGQLWDSLDDSKIPLPVTQQAELRRRLATLDQDRAEAVTWGQLRAELARRCRCLVWSRGNVRRDGAGPERCAEVRSRSAQRTD